MNALEFLNIFAEKKKSEVLNKLSREEKTHLVVDFKKIINDYWNNCHASTNIKLGKAFSSIDEQILHLDNLLSFVDWTKIKYNYDISKTQKSIYQWSIFYCELGHNIGSEKNKTRPVLILQDMRDYLDARTVLIAPITTGSKVQYKHEIKIDTTEKKRISGIIDLSQYKISKSCQIRQYSKG